MAALMKSENQGDPWDWSPPSDWIRIRCIDAHTGGEPLRVIVAGFPQPSGTTVLERRRDARLRSEEFRTALMWEPRGHADMYGCLLIPPETDDADIGVLFLHNQGYSTMCGHGIIAVTVVALETGILAWDGVTATVRIDTPAGRVTAVASGEGGRVASVRFTNVPSFVLELDAQVDVPGLGLIRYDLAFGGAFYAYVDAAECGLSLTAADYGGLIERGTAIKEAVAAGRQMVHPQSPDLEFLYGTIFVGAAEGEGAHSRNVCVFADGEVDRSPTGTGVAGRMAIDYARGRVGVGEARIIESIVGSRFRAWVLDETHVGSLPAVTCEVEGQAWLTGRHEFWIDPNDPLRTGFFLR